MKLTLRLATDSDDRAKVERVKQAVERKQAATETMAEAWRRIFAMKNSDADRRKLTEVRDAMARGVVGRHPADVAKRFSKAEALRLWAELQELKREETLRRMVDELPANYELITTVPQLQSLVTALAAESIIAVDTETTGVDVYTDKIVGISFSLPKADRHVYIPVDHADTTPQLDREFVLRELKPILYDESIGKVLHNAIFDIAMFRRHGYDLRGVVWDTQTAMHLLNENEPSFKLKDLAPKYLGVESDTFDQLFGKNAQFRDIPLDIALAYAAKDTHLTWRLYEFQRHHMAKLPTILEYYQTVEVPLLYVIVDLEANGYILDLDYAKKYGEELRERAEKLREEIVAELSPHYDGESPLNINSVQQMRPTLSKAIGRELPNMDAKKTLKPLAGKHPVIAKLLEYKKITKLSGTYIETLPLKQNPTTKRWHSRFNPMGTVTGRFSSGKDDESSSDAFNVQNQPDEARAMFVAPPGKVLVSADFKAQEIRCVAYLSGEPVLIDAFLNNRDPYASMAAMFYKRPYEEVYKNPDGSDTKERKEFKVVWLATLYGMSDYSLAELLGTSKDEAVEFKKQIFGTMPKLNEWLEGNKEFVRKYGFVWADKMQRKRRLPDAKKAKKVIPFGKWNDPKFAEARAHNSAVNRALRQATNARVQGSSAIQTKVTMLRAWEYCKQREGWALWATVHDELIFEIPEDFTREDAQIIRDIMINSYKWGDVVPNGTDLEVGYRWGQFVTVDDWLNGIRPEK